MKTISHCASNDIRWYEDLRWLSPFARWQGSFVTTLTPQEIAWRLYPHFVAAPEPEMTYLHNKLKPGLDRLFGYAPQMTEQKRLLLATNANLSRSESVPKGDLMYGSLHPCGFSIARYESDPIWFHAHYRPTPAGARIDAWFGWNWSLSMLYRIGFEFLFILVLLYVVDTSPPGILRIFGYLVLTLAVLILGFNATISYVGNSWARRNDYVKYRALIIDVLDAREIGPHQ